MVFVMCNCFEVYVEMDEFVIVVGVIGVEVVIEVVEFVIGIFVVDFDGVYVVYLGCCVVEYFFFVVFGLEFVVFGEGEIVG